jgi:hypothetical protein
MNKPPFPSLTLKMQVTYSPLHSDAIAGLQVSTKIKPALFSFADEHVRDGPKRSCAS